MGEIALYRAFGLVERLGVPIAVLAWIVVLGGSVGMGLVLRRHPMRGCWVPSLAVGSIAFVAHVLDYLVTLRISPDLALEANPIWRIVVDRMGLGVAEVYGLSGKILVSVLSFELFAFYLIQRESLFPDTATGFLDFQQRFGAPGTAPWVVRWQNIASYFAFMFALLSPYYFYIAWLNGISANETLYDRFPSPLVAIAAYLGMLTVAYAVANYRAFRRWRRAKSAGAAASGVGGRR